MFRTLIFPSSGACDCVELPHRSSCSQFVVCWSFCCGWYLVVFVLQASACNTGTTQNQPHQSSNTQRTENKTTDVVIEHSRKLLMMEILMSETCWAHKKWNKIASDIKLVFHSSTITMMHGPINIRLTSPVSVSRLRITRAIPLLPLYAFMGRTRTICEHDILFFIQTLSFKQIQTQLLFFCYSADRASQYIILISTNLMH